MRVLLVVNPRSGRGGARAVAAVLCAGLQQAGHDASIDDCDAADLALQVADTDLVVVVGGDGTVNSIAPHCVKSGTPIYHAPTGTENLFARDFGMTCGLQRLLDAIEVWDVRRMDTGEANGRQFLLMVSTGVDAGVVHRLKRPGSGTIRHRSYLKPILQEIWSPTLPILTIRVDGDVLVEGMRGSAIIGNSRQYGWRLDPCRDASVFDGNLQVVFLPARTSAAMLRWAALVRSGRHLRSSRVRSLKGREIAIVCAEEVVWQADGEPFPRGREMCAMVNPGALPVLCCGEDQSE